MKSCLILGLCLLAQSSLSLPAAQFIWHPGEDAEASPFLDMGRLLPPSPHFHGTELPTPPQQGQPWTPSKTQLPDVALDAMKALFDEGLVDPRGCDYREIKVAVGNCWSGDSGVVTTHGWILPGKESFAICWNGLVYPVVSAGPAADLRADILAMLTAAGGVAWQAEEVLTNGKWERFLGIVTKHRVARVPGSDIEFILPGFWSQLPHGIDCIMTTPHGDTTSWRGSFAYEPVPQGQPVLATLAVRNRSGLDQTLPADLVRDAANAKVLPDGVKLTLLYSEKMPPKRKPEGGAPQPNEFGPWTPIPIRAESYPTPSAVGDAKTVMVLAPTAEKTLFQIDLRDFFDLSRPGSYRLQTDMQRPDAFVGQPAETSFIIVAAH